MFKRIHKNKVLGYVKKCQENKIEVHNIPNIYIIPCKMNPLNNWCSPMLINSNNLKSINDFKNYLNHYSYYNLNNEMGLYPSFYIKEN